jgi:hypothetical protein
MTLKEIDEAIQRGGGIVIEKPDERLLDELVRTGRVLDPSKRTWPSLPTDELLPTGDKPVDLIGAACGTPEGMTFLIPFARGSRPAAAAM